MTIAVTGSKGLLGSEFKNYLKDNAYYLDRPEFNVSSQKSLEKFLKTHEVKYLINCAAYTNVPLAEKERESAYLANAQALGVLSGLCGGLGIHLIHFSTDFVFDGMSTSPYKETDDTNPLNYYGSTKLEGERILQKNMPAPKNFTIFRLQWLYGHSPKTFFSKILEKAEKGEKLNIVNDEFGSPCSVRFIRETVINCINNKETNFKGKIFHLTHDDYCSRYECGKYFLNKLGYTNIEPINDLPMKDVVRPKFGVMNNTELVNSLGISLGSWKEDLDIYIDELKNV
jgi:dTDP-4-dehydrorhamnose reductase